MAEGLMQRKLAREGRAGEIRAASAGVRAVDGVRATAHAITTMSGRGMDIAGHRSRAITNKIVEDAALILTMEQDHADVIKAKFPQHANRVHLLSEMAGLDGDVEDPVGGTLEDYSQTAQEIQDLIEHGFPKIMQLIGE
jgi:protein arginine phosphatase